MSNQHAPSDRAARSASPDMLELRLLASLIEAACADDDDAREENLHSRYREVSERILDRPVRSWADVVEIAEIAFFLADKESDGELLALAGACGEDDQAAAELVMAVLTMAEGGEHV